MRIHTKALALSCGLIMGALLTLATLSGMLFGCMPTITNTLKELYPGYSLSLIGSIIIFLYGFLTGGSIGAMIGIIYNRLFVRM